MKPPSTHETLEISKLIKLPVKCFEKIAKNTKTAHLLQHNLTIAFEVYSSVFYFLKSMAFEDC